MQKVEVYIFDRANLSAFATREFTRKENLNQQKQVFLVNLGLRSTQKSKFWSLFFGKIFTYEKFVA